MRCITICLLMTVVTLVHAQEIEQPPVEQNVFEVWVDQNGPSNDLYIAYALEPRNTLYSLSKRFSTTINAILDANPVLKQRIPQLGDQLLIPLSRHFLLDESAEEIRAAGTPIIYTVKPGETLFGIARRTLDMSIPAIAAHNQIVDNALSPGQSLIIGYLPEQYTESETMASDSTTSHTVRYDSAAAYTFPEETHAERGIAYWRKTSSVVSSSARFALHRTARVGSVIEVINPMFDTKVYAKVIGRLPEKAYTNDIRIVVSAAVAKSLGALDERFYVKIRYIE